MCIRDSYRGPPRRLCRRSFPGGGRRMTKIPHYDVIIIGAGSVGAPSAFFMAQRGLKVLVLDRVPSVGQGSNKKAIGGIRATHSDPAKIQVCLRSIETVSYTHLRAH